MSGIVTPILPFKTFFFFKFFYGNNVRQVSGHSLLCHLIVGSSQLKQLKISHSYLFTGLFKQYNFWTLKEHIKRKCSERIVFEMPKLYFLDSICFSGVFHILNILDHMYIFLRHFLSLRCALRPETAYHFCTDPVHNYTLSSVVLGLWDRKGWCHIKAVEILPSFF